MTWFANPGWRTQSRAALDAAPSGGAYTGPGDIVSGAYAWWGLRAYNNAYISGAKHLVDLFDASGSNPVTIDCTSTGVFDIGAYNTWATAHSVTAGTALVSKIYDQTTNGLHFVQSTSANMPTFSPSAVISVLVSGGAGGRQMKVLTAGFLTLAQPLSMSAIVNRVTNNASDAAFFENDDSGFSIIISNTLHIVDTSGFASSNALTLNTTSAVQASFVSGTNNAAKYVDGTNTTGTCGTFAFASDPIDLLSGTVDVIKFTEGGLWSGDKSGLFSALNTNQHAAYGGF